MRELDDIFESLKEMAESRELTQKSHKKPPSCLCGKNLIHHDVNGEELQDTDGIYVDHTAKGAEFAVCPACNPRMNCPTCNGTGHRSLLYADFEEIRLNACSCMYLENLVEKLNKAKIPDKYVHAEFSAFNFNHIQDKNLVEKLKKKYR